MNLAPLMKPASIAVVGASQRMTRATRVVANLQRFGYSGRIFPINPKYREVLGLPCYPDLGSTPEPADTVVVAIPAEQVPGILASAVESGVRGAVVLSSGFVDVMLRDEAVDVVAVNLRVNVPRPGGGAPSRPFSRAMIAALPKNPGRLVLAFSSFAGGDLDQEVVRALADGGVPFLESTETAMLALRNAREHRRFLDRPERAPSATPSPRSRGGASGTLSSTETMQLLREFGVPLAQTIAVKDAAAAVTAADRLGYPVVLKIDSPDIAHKTDVGGVRVGCPDPAAVRTAFREMLVEVGRRVPTARLDGALIQRMIAGGREMILGVKTDPLFGPAVLCGFGGLFVEQLRDVSLRVPPIGPADAAAMIAELRGAAILSGARGRAPADTGALADAIVGVAALAEAHRQSLRALDINPLLVLDDGHGVVAVDWLIELT